MEWRHSSANIGISFIGADHEGSRFGDCEITPGHARSRREKSRTSIVPHELGKMLRVVIARIGAYGASEQLSHVLARLVDGWEHNMAGRLAIKLLDSFAQIRFDDLDSA